MNIPNIPKSLLLYLILLLIISFIPFILSEWGGYLLNTPFTGFEYQTFDEFLQVWHSAYLGMYSVLLTPNLFLAFILFKLLPPAVANVVFVGLIKFVAGVCIYILLGRFTQNQTIRIVGSIFYLLSIYGQAIVENTPSGGYLFYALFPLMIYLFIFITRKNAPFYLLLYVLSALALGDTNFTYNIYLFTIFLLYAVYSFALKKDLSRFFYLILFGMLFIFVNFYYFLPLFSYNYVYKNDIVGKNLQAESAGWKGTYSSPAEILRLMGSLDFYNKYSLGSIDLYARPYFLYFIHRPLIAALTFLIPIIALSGLFFALKTKKGTYSFQVIFYSFCFVLFYFFSVGAHIANPLRELYQVLSEKFLFFAIFRDPYKSVSVINLVYTIGVVYFFLYFARYKKTYQILLCLFLGLIMVLSLIYLKGGVYGKSELVKIPSWAGKYASWQQKDATFFRSKKLLFPHQPFPILTFANYPGKGSPYYYQISNSTLVQGNAQFTSYIDQIQSLILTPKFSQIAGFYDVPYVIVSRGLDPNFYQTIKAETILKRKHNDFRQLASFGPRGNINVFSLPQQYLNPIIYTPRTVVSATESAVLADDIDLSSVFSHQPMDNFAFATPATLRSIPQKKIDTPDITVNKKSNTDYEVTINHMKNDFLLVFNENYNRGWVMKKNVLATTELPLTHVQVNGFTNGYWISASTIRSAFPDVSPDKPVTLHLYFQPQLYFYVGLGISAFTILVVISYFLRSKIRL